MPAKEPVGRKHAECESSDRSRGLPKENSLCLLRRVVGVFRTLIANRQACWGKLVPAFHGCEVPSFRPAKHLGKTSLLALRGRCERDFVFSRVLLCECEETAQLSFWRAGCKALRMPSLSPISCRFSRLRWVRKVIRQIMCRGTKSFFAGVKYFLPPISAHCAPELPPFLTSAV